MTVSERAFAQAWFLLKSRENGVAFTDDERDFVTGTIVKMMNSGDLRLQEEASLLYDRFRRVSQ